MGVGEVGGIEQKRKIKRTPWAGPQGGDGLGVGVGVGGGKAGAGDEQWGRDT